MWLVARVCAATGSVCRCVACGACSRQERRSHPNTHEYLRLPKLGSCFGGWDCMSPSYLSPAHYSAFKDFVLHYESLLVDEPTYPHALARTRHKRRGDLSYARLMTPGHVARR
jgi:hypothetical protein